MHDHFQITSERSKEWKWMRTLGTVKVKQPIELNAFDWKTKFKLDVLIMNCKAWNLRKSSTHSANKWGFGDRRYRWPVSLLHSQSGPLPCSGPGASAPPSPMVNAAQPNNHAAKHLLYNHPEHPNNALEITQNTLATSYVSLAENPRFMVAWFAQKSTSQIVLFLVSHVLLSQTQSFIKQRIPQDIMATVKKSSSFPCYDHKQFSSAKNKAIITNYHTIRALMCQRTVTGHFKPTKDQK